MYASPAICMLTEGLILYICDTQKAQMPAYDPQARSQFRRAQLGQQFGGVRRTSKDQRRASLDSLLHKPLNKGDPIRSHAESHRKGSLSPQQWSRQNKMHNNNKPGRRFSLGFLKNPSEWSKLRSRTTSQKASPTFQMAPMGQYSASTPNVANPSTLDRTPTGQSGIPPSVPESVELLEQDEEDITASAQRPTTFLPHYR